MNKLLAAAALVALTASAQAYDLKPSGLGMVFQAMSNCGENNVGYTERQKLTLAILVMSALGEDAKAFEAGQSSANNRLSRTEACALAKAYGKKL